MTKATFNGARLKDARLLRGMSISTLAETTDLTKQSISLYESNTIKPEFEKGLKLAQALNIPYSFFFQSDDCKANSGTTYFRSLTSTTKAERQQQITKLEYVAKMREALMNFVTFPSLSIPNVSFSCTYDESDLDLTDEEKVTIEEIAETLRKKWNLGDDPIEDLQYLVESNGIILTSFATGTDLIDAFSQKITLNNGADSLFAISVALDDKPEVRINFDIAHELGHILLHPWTEDIEDVSKEEFRRREFQANYFAGAFLLPKTSFGKDVSYYGTDLQHYERLKNKWKVSIQAMIVRSYHLKAISANQYQYLFRKFSKNGWRKGEPGDHPFQLRENVFQGAIDLLKQNNYRSEQILKLFANYGADFFPEEIEELLHLSKGTLKRETPSAISFLTIKDSNKEVPHA